MSEEIVHPAVPSKAAQSRRAVYVSIGVILSGWIGFTIQQVLTRPVPQSVPSLFLRKSLETAVVVLLIWLLLRLGNESLSELGFRIGQWRMLPVYGVLVPIGLFVAANVVLNSFLTAAMGHSPGSPVRSLFRDPRQAPLWILIAVIGGGFGEELQRAFVLTRFERVWGRTGLVVAVVVDTAVFGIRHLYQGLPGAISAGFTGLVFALIFLRRRQAVLAMVAHAGYDLIGIATAYALYGR